VNALYNWNWVAADRDFRRALELNSGVPEVHHRYAFFYLAPAGRAEEALSHIQQAKNLDPMSLVLHAAECAVLVWGRQLEAAIERGRKTVELEPTYYPGHMYLSWAYRRSGMLTQAIEKAEEAVRLSAGTPLSLGGLGLSYAAAGKSDEALKVVDQIQQRPYMASTSIASIYAAIGEIEEALKWLDRARQERSPGLVYLQVATWSESVRSDPRFDELVRAVGLCESRQPLGF
jgi:tetratricopeptide (TPR) repeat protein